MVLFIYLAVLGVGTLDLLCITWDHLLWCTHSLVATWGLTSCSVNCPLACTILVPQPGIKPSSSALQGRFLSTGEVAQSCPTLCDLMDCSLPDSSVHGIFQERILEWFAISFSRGTSWPRDRSQVSCIVGRCFTIWATREAPSSP